MRTLELILIVCWLCWSIPWILTGAFLGALCGTIGAGKNGRERVADFID